MAAVLSLDLSPRFDRVLGIMSYPQSSISSGVAGIRWILGVLLLCSATPTMGEAPFRAIFNGEDLTGWDGDERYWSVEDGVIVGAAEAGALDRNTFLIWNQGEVDDFELRFRYRITSDWANSGVQVRSERLEDYVVAGYQPDIATEDWITGIHYEERGRGILARRGERTVIDADGERTTSRFASEEELYREIRPRDWNEYHVVARGNRITTRINGVRMHEVEDHSPEARRSGVIAFQLHTGPAMRIEFSDVELRRLPTEGRRKVVFWAGPRSHGFGHHEHRAGSLLLAEMLNRHFGDEIIATVYSNGRPADPTAFDNANALVMFSNGGGGHPVRPHLEEIDALAESGVGIGAIHYAVEPHPDDSDYFERWLGGYFRIHWSVNPHWTANIETLPEDPLTRGVRPFSLYDEWYYHMAFRDEMEGVVPILSALPPEESLNRPDGPHSNNPHVREAVLERGEAQHLMWRSERPGGKRGFGITGAHYHWNWAQDDFRTAVLNAIVWIAGAEVPEDGVPSHTPTLEELLENQAYDMPENFDRGQIQQQLDAWRER